MGLAKHQKLSKSEYNSLTTKDEDTFYAVNENGDFSEENLEDTAELFIGDKKVSIKVLQETGQSTEDTMSQKAITDAITDTVNSNILPFAICTTGGSQITKTVTTSVGHFILTTGARIAIRFNYNHTAAKMTLNVNGTGEKSVYYKGTNVGANMVYSYTVYEFVYDGTYWRITGVDTDTTYEPATSTTDGLMSSEDKVKLDAVDDTYLPLTGGVITGSLETKGLTHLSNYANGKVQMLQNAAANANNSVAIGYYSRVGYNTGDTSLPYLKVSQKSTLPFTIDGKTLYGVSLAKSDSTTYIYNGVSHTVTNPNSSASASVFLINTTNTNFLFHSSLPIVAFCEDYKIYNGTILSYVNIEDNILQIIVKQSVVSILSYTTNTNVFLWEKTSSSSYSAVNGFSIGNNSITTGQSALAMSKAVSTGAYGVSIGHDSMSIEQGGIAIGQRTYSEGVQSCAIGSLAKAKASYSNAIGTQCVAKASYSNAMGYNTKANKSAATGIGRDVIADGNYAVVIGNNGKSYGDYSVLLGYNNSIGILTNDSSFPYAKFETKDAQKFIADGVETYGLQIPVGVSKTYTFNGIEYTATNTASAMSSLFIVKDNANTLFKNDLSPKHIANTSDTTTHTNQVIFNSNDLGNGYYSILVNQQVAGTRSYKLPVKLFLWNKTNSTQYKGTGAVNMAFSSHATSNMSFCAGEQLVNTGYSSVCLGRLNYVSGEYSFVDGRNNMAAGGYSFVHGLNNCALGNISFIVGNNNKVAHDNGCLIGNGLKTSVQNQVIFGTFNLPSQGVFVIGNGTADNIRSNIFEVSKTGDVTANTFIGDLQGNLVDTLPVSQGGTGRTIFYADTVLTGQGTDKDTGEALPIGARNIASEITDDNVDDIPNVYAVKQALENKSVQSLNINIDEDVQITSGANHEQYIYVNDIGNYIINAHFTVKTYNSSTYPEYNVKIKLISTNLETLQSTILSQTQINANWSGITKGQDIHNISLSGIFNIQSMLTQNTKIVIENDGQGVIDIMGNNFCQINILKIS